MPHLGENGKNSDFHNKLLYLSVAVFRLTGQEPNFITEMIQGTIYSKSVLISEILRAISTENNNIKHVEKRLLRKIKNINNQNEFQNKYQTFIDNKFDDKTIFRVDNSDIIKHNPYSKFEYIRIIKDGSTDDYKPGYHVTSIVALDSQNNNPIPVYNKVFSLKEDAVTSTHMETENALLQSFKHLKNKGYMYLIEDMMISN